MEGFQKSKRTSKISHIITQYIQVLDRRAKNLKSAENASVVMFETASKRMSLVEKQIYIAMY